MNYDEMNYDEMKSDVRFKLNRIEASLEKALAEVQDARRMFKSGRYGYESIAIALRDMDYAASSASANAEFLADDLYRSKYVTID